MAATVLVPLDGSDKDDRALSVAAAFASLTDGALHLIRVLDEGADAPSARGEDLDPADAAGAARDEAARALRAAADGLEPLAGRPVTSEVAAGADVAEVLLRRAEDLDAALVVMATRAPGAVGRAVRGSVADRVVREGLRPVVLVPPRAEHVAGKRVQMGRALVPLDTSAAARGMVDHLLRLPRVGDLEFVLLEVVPPVHAHGAAAGDAGEHATAQRAERRLEVVADRLRARGATVDVRVVEAGDPAAVIGGAVRQELVDFIAMSTRGASGLERMVLGSVAAAVVRASEVPVLLRTPTES